jgi:hypothetical protein
MTYARPSVLLEGKLRAKNAKETPMYQYTCSYQASLSEALTYYARNHQKDSDTLRVSMVRKV